MNNFAPNICHDYLLDRADPALRFDPSRDYEAWRRELEARLRELVGWMPEPVPPDVRIERDECHADFREIRFVFTSEHGVDVPCHLLIPPSAKHPTPVIICLQGHSTGMHISLGRPKFEKDAQSIAGGRDFAIQAVKQGYVALAIEQRAFGERKGPEPNHDCKHPTMAALLLGRTMIGERVWDVSRAIDVLYRFPEVDLGRIGIMGNSGGGTVTWYASCLEPRITAAMPSCAFCTYADSIGRIYHCVDNYLPSALRFFDMQDLSALIAPRPLVVVAGREDTIFPIAGVEKAMDTVKKVYSAAGSPDRCRLVVGSEGHRFYPDEAWPVFREMTGWESSA